MIVPPSGVRVWLIEHLKLMIAKLQRDRFGPTSERSSRLLNQLELQLEELEADAAEAEASRPEPVGNAGRGTARAKPVRGPLPAHLPRERVVIPGPTECPCCRGKLAKLGETVTMDVIDRAIDTEEAAASREHQAQEAWFDRQLWAAPLSFGLA